MCLISEILLCTSCFISLFIIRRSSNNEIFSDEDKEYITTSIQKLENETDFDYYETKKEDDYEL